jgi:hypothetical protein
VRKVPMFLAAPFLAASFAAAPPTAPPAFAADPEQIPIASYDVTQTPMSGYGCWTHVYTGSIVDTGRAVTGSVTCGPGTPDHLANYYGGGGTLNDNIFSTSSDHNQLLLTTMNAADGLPIEPVITLHLAKLTRVKRISIYGGDVAWNVLPGALNAATIEIEGKPVFMSSAPFGTPNVLGVPANDLFDIDYTEQSWMPTKTVVLKDFHADFFGSQFNQFSITEIVVEGVPIKPVTIDVKPGEKDPVSINTGRGKIPVAILGSSTFDVGKIEVSGGSLTFGTFGWEVSLADCSGPQDVNKDRVPDLVCHFVNYAIDWTQGFTTVRLHGSTIDGKSFYGTDEIQPAPRL